MSARASAAIGAAVLMGGFGWALAQDKPSGADDAQLAFNNACRTCHTVKEGDNRLGPSLHQVLGRKSASVPGYGYSGAMRNADIVWDKATLDRFIANAESVVRGNGMQPYGGIASAEDRAKIIAYLEKN
jgi:cytochrome c